jgi:hypothetical protein
MKQFYIKMDTRYSRESNIIKSMFEYVCFKMMIPNDEIKSNHPRRLTTHHRL